MSFTLFPIGMQNGLNKMTTNSDTVNHVSIGFTLFKFLEGIFFKDFFKRYPLISEHNVLYFKIF